MSTESKTPETDALWCELMEACRKSGIAPARCEAFSKLGQFRQLETQRDEARADVERLRKMLGNERDAVKRYIITFQRRMPECWLEHFERAGCVTFDEIGFVKAVPVVTTPQSLPSDTAIPASSTTPEIFEAHGNK